MKTEKEVPLKKGYKYRIYPNKQQEEKLGQLFGCSRYVYNKLLEENNKAYELYKTTKDKVHLKSLSGKTFCYKLVEFKNDPDLVKIVEVLGSEKASGSLSELQIVEIPDDIEYEINDYDGVETIHEKHQSW